MNLFSTIWLPDEIRSRIEAEHRLWMHSQDQPMERERLTDVIGDVEGLLCTITDCIDENLLTRAEKLKVIANYGVGFDHVDVAAASRRSILVTNTPGVLTDATADLAFALILSLARRVVEGDRMTREGRFRYWAPFHFLGLQVAGKTLGVIGMGRIGQAVAKRAAGFAMRVLYHSRRGLDVETEQSLGASRATLDDLLRESDFVSLHVPLAPETRHLIGRRELELMKPSACLINTARGPVVDEAALVDALRQGLIHGAGLDVYENEPELAPGLALLANVVLLPHVGSATVQTRTLMAAMAVENLLTALRGDKPPNCLNWDAVAQSTRAHK
ncbi:MAG: 2-hydroxyacid dehydrogenase [Syntrophobacteraceae bacterium]